MDLRLLEKIALVAEVARSGVIKLPDERLFPVGPGFGACALSVSQRQQHQRIECWLISDNGREFNCRLGVVDVSLLSECRHGHVVVDQADERAALSRLELETNRGPLRKNRACFRVRPGANRTAGIVQEQSQVENERVWQVLEHLAIATELCVLRVRESVEL